MKFVVADGGKGMIDILYNDLRKDTRFDVINKYCYFKNGFLNKLCLLNISVSLNLRIRMPLKLFFYKKIFGNYHKEKDICFFFGTSWFDPELFTYLRKEYPYCHLVFNFHDTVESKLNRFKNMDIPYLKNTFDLIYTFSEIDQNKYGFEYTPDMYSKQSISKIKNYPFYDVVFIGAAKDRVKKILAIYEKLTAMGLSCWFCIVRAKEDEKKYKDKIFYTDKNVPFDEVISRQYHARCLLEITQEGAVDATLRFWDAVMYNKLVITNCHAVKKYQYYNPEFVLLINNADDINAEFFKQDKKVNFNYNGDVSPISVFNAIEQKLQKQ